MALPPLLPLTSTKNRVCSSDPFRRSCRFLAKSSVLLLPTALAAKILLPVIPSLIAMFIEEDAADDAVPFIA